MLQIVGEDTLLRQTIKRINGFVPPENIWIVTTEDKAQDIRFHLETLGSLARKDSIHQGTRWEEIQLQPSVWLPFTFNHLSSDSVMIVMPSDHAITG